MIYSKKLLKPLFIAFTIASTIATHSITFFNRSTVPNIGTAAGAALSSLNYKSASVLPFYHHQKNKYVILSRESGGNDKGTYDDFSGAKDKKIDTNFSVPSNKKGKNPTILPARILNGPVITAAREFNEEAILQKTIGLDVMQTIDLLNKQSQFIISYSQRNGCDRNNPKDPCNVAYITNFNKYARPFFKNFYAARKNAKEYAARKNAKEYIYKEKDKIAVVTWNSLKNAIITHEKETNSFMRRWFGSFLSPQSKTITIPALELQEDTLTFKPAMITLRPYFVKKLKLFFLDKPYKQGKNKRIRHYSE